MWPPIHCRRLPSLAGLARPAYQTVSTWNDTDMTWRVEFPDFTDMPAIPENWQDVSWHNDIAPSFADDTGCFLLFVDYADESKREFSGHPRFAVYHSDES